MSQTAKEHCIEFADDQAYALQMCPVLDLKHILLNYWHQGAYFRGGPKHKIYRSST